jgi:flagellar basal-body rod protein FlgG
MNLSLYSGATGMQAQQLNLNVISNNIANVNTTGYKKNKIEFQDLLYQNPRQSGGQTGAGNVVPTGVEMGNGTKVVSTAKIYTQGQLTQTNEKMDVAIDGGGFFRLKDLMALRHIPVMELSKWVPMGRLPLRMPCHLQRVCK